MKFSWRKDSSTQTTATSGKVSLRRRKGKKINIYYELKMSSHLHMAAISKLRLQC